MGFWLIAKGNDYFNIHKKFRVDSTNIFGIKSENKYRQMATTLPLYL